MSENVPSRDTPIPWWRARALLRGGNWTDAAYGFGDSPLYVSYSRAPSHMGRDGVTSWKRRPTHHGRCVRRAKPRTMVVSFLCHSQRYYSFGNCG